jgi:biopolymer transport protein ExbD
MDQAGRIYYDGRWVSVEALREQLRSVSRDVPFLIRADKRVPLQYFVEVLGTVKGAGFKRVSVQTERLAQ